MFPISDDNPRHIQPIVTWSLIGACILVFLWEHSLGDYRGQAAVMQFGMIPARLFGYGEISPAFVVIPGRPPCSPRCSCMAASCISG